MGVAERFHGPIGRPPQRRGNPLGPKGIRHAAIAPHRRVLVNGYQDFRIWAPVKVGLRSKKSEVSAGKAIPAWMPHRHDAHGNAEPAW